MKRKHLATVVAFSLFFIGVIVNLAIKGDWYSVVVGVSITASLLPWTLSAKRITGKPVHHPLNLLVMGIIAAVATVLSSIISERIGIRSIEGGQVPRAESTVVDITSPTPFSRYQIDSGAADTESEAICCGDLSEEERVRARRELADAFVEPELASAEIRDHLPADGVVDQTRDALQSQGQPENEILEIDWDDIRLGILENLESVEQAGVASMILDAEQFMASMGPHDAARIVSRTQRIWDRAAQRHESFPTTGPEAAMFRKLFEMRAVLELSELRKKQQDYERDRELLMRSVTEAAVQERLSDWESYRKSASQESMPRNRRTRNQ